MATGPLAVAGATCGGVSWVRAASILAARVAGLALQAIGAVTELSVSVKVPPVMVPPNVIVWMAALVAVPAVVVATVTLAPVPVSPVASAAMVDTAPGAGKTTPILVVVELTLPAETTLLPWRAPVRLFSAVWMFMASVAGVASQLIGPVLTPSKVSVK